MEPLHIISILIMILSEIHISAVKLYCYFSRNKSINESGSYWIASAVSYATIAVVFILILIEAHWIWFALVATLNILSNNKTRKVSLGNITGQWAEMRNEKEVEKSIAAAQKETMIETRTSIYDDIMELDLTPDAKAKVKNLKRREWNCGNQ